MKKTYNVILDPYVKLQLDNHIRFATNVSSKFAKAIRDNFYKVLHELSNSPDRYPLWYPDFKLSKPYRKVLIKKRYSLLFYISNDTVFVDYLLDCRMDNNKIFFNFKI